MAADPTTSRTIDDILLEDAGFDSEDDPFNDTRPPLNTERDDKPTLSPRKRKAADDDDPFAKNIDEEVKITKQRKKIPKLDAERLLSEPGIPKIRTLLRSGQFQKKLRLKGKGHEFTDAARLLNYYQLWLDNLYPRAKFMDAVQLVEKAGHTKKMQMYRKSWIDEGKPGFIRREEVDEAIENQETARIEDQNSTIQANQNSRTPDPADEDPSLLFFANGDDEGPAGNNEPDDDELDALMAQGASDTIPPPRGAVIEDDSEGEDDLDALLAQESSNPRPRTTRPMSPRQDTTTQAETGEERPKTLDEAVYNFEDEDLDDLDALLNSHTATTEPELPAISSESGRKSPEQETVTTNSEDVPELVNTVSSSPIPNIDIDELDDLLNEHDANIMKKAEKANDGIVEEFIASSPIPGQDSQ